MPAGIHLVPLPPASPELQPAERVWPLRDAAVATRASPDIAALEEALVGRCRTPRADRRTSNAHTLYLWWPANGVPTDPHSD